MAQPLDEDNDIQMSTEQDTTNNAPITTNTTNDQTNNDNTNTTENSENKDNTINTTDNKDQEEKKVESPSTNYGINPLELVQSALCDFVNEMSAADIKGTSLYQQHIQKQQHLMNQFVADSLRLMHEFNTFLHPIQNVLHKLKQPLQDVLLNQFISIPCESLDEITKQQTQTMYNKTWGVSPLTHEYNQRHKISQNPHLQYMDLGAVIKSLKSSIKKAENNGNDEVDSEMRDKSEEELYTQAVLEFVSNPNNITTSQTDLVLKFFTTARAEQQRLEIKQQQIFAKMQQKQRQKEQRESGAAMLLSIVTWLTEDAAMGIMEMKSDNIEQAIDYCMNTDQMNVYIEVKEWKKNHPTATLSSTDGDIDMNKKKYNKVRSDIDMRVMNRSATTGETKAVTFRCISISDDGVMTLQAILDRNNIPLDPITAKLLFLSISDLMNYEGVRIEHEESVLCAQNERVLSIVFQVVQNNKQAEEEDVYNDMYDMVSSHLSNYGGGGHRNNRNRNRYNKYNNKKATEFVPIQFAPRCRDLEYEWEFEDKTPANNSCLKSVKHRMDGAVLFRGIYDDGSSLHLFGSSVEQPIDIYSQILDDVTHNILCIIFENDLRDNVVIDVRNISFTEQTLSDVINQSKSDFIKQDAAGNKISYRIIVENSKIIAVLTKFGNEIREMAYIEHGWMCEGELICIPSRNMLGIIKCLPTGLIVTNDPHKNISQKRIKYAKNVHSKIFRKHCADLDGFIDVDIVKEGGNWREIDNPLCQSFVVTDIKQCSENDRNEFIKYKQTNQINITDEIENLITNVENDFNLIKNKNKNNQENKSDLLNKTINNVKQIQELLSNFKTRKSNLNQNEKKFITKINDNIQRYNREIRALRFEVKMNSNQ